MSKLDVKENKRLKLLNVLIKRLESTNFEVLESEGRKFINFLHMSKIKTRGPIITKCYGTQVSNTGEISFNFDIMVQTLDKVNPIMGHVFEDSLIVENCLYVHFEGDPGDVVFVQNKLDLHIWENELLYSGEEYRVNIESSSGLLIADFFRPVEI